MNRQPYGTPPRWWEPKLDPKWVALSRKYRWRTLRRGQRIESVDVEGLEHVRQAVADGHGVLVIPNHSTHYDSEALYVAFDKISQPVFFMTAWQVFAMSKRFQRVLMQRFGCFSIDRESTDRQAFKQAIRILQEQPHPLVIFPEGDIYHVSDRVTTFREGAAAIALSAVKRSERPVVVIPCAIKFWYLNDPTNELQKLVQELEERVLLRPQPELSFKQRILRLGEGVLALKELDYLGNTSSGTVPDRINSLTEAVVSQLEQRHDIRPNGQKVPERVKELRQCVIRKANGDPPADADIDGFYRSLENDMDDIFFVMQLYSYPGDYLSGQPSIERIAETLDKLEEDVLGVELPSVHGRRRVTIRFGEPLPVTNASGGRRNTSELTGTMQDAVQSLIDGLNADFSVS